MALDPRLSRLTVFDGVTAWLVDGRLVRDCLDIEFTNCTHHYDSPYVPAHEVWVDRSAPGADEGLLWAARATAERGLRARGVPAADAAAVARVQEAHVRQQQRGATRPDVHRTMFGAHDGFEVWLVRGRAVRDWYDVDFTCGGNPMVYPWVPRGEVWLDDALVQAEYAPTAFHEVLEAGLMQQGMSYAAAHARASTEERRLRQNYATCPTGRARSRR